jgi:hypothetical protein
MKTDGVAAAFELIVEEIEAVASEIADQGSRAFRDKTYDTAQQLGESGKSLQSFRAKVVDLLEEWQSGIDVTTRQRFTRPRPKKIATSKTHTKGPRTRLRVTFADGASIEEYYAADTFALALQKLGFDRVAALGITERNVPLVGLIKSDQYGQRRIDGQYVCTHSSTPEKKETLERVAKKLGVSLKVEIV